MLRLCDDILKVIIVFLDDECVVFARTCKRLRELVHCVRKTMLITDNVFEAIRCGSLLSLANAELPTNISRAPIIQYMNVDMLMYFYEKFRDDDNYLDIVSGIVSRLCKMGKLISTSRMYHNPSLIVHAITHNKQDLLRYMEDKCSQDNYIRYCVYGYAKIGDYDNFILYYHSNTKYDRLKYYACVGRNEKIMRIADVDTYNRQYAMIAHYRDEALLQGELEVYIFDCAVQLAKRDDHELFARIDTGELHHNQMMEICIKYNAINIVKHIISTNLMLIYNYIYAMKSIGNISMTMEMAELLLECTDNESETVALIVRACNYRLTEMLREKGLYDKKLTMKSSHTEFVMWNY